MQQRFKGFVCVLMLTLMAVGTVHAKDHARAASELSELLSDYSTYQASFTQFVTDGRGDRVQQTEGQLKAKRPGRFYWHTDAPMEQIIVARGDEVKVYDPDLLQVTVYPMDEQLSSTPALLLSGEVVDLEKSFHITRESDDEGGEKFILEPLDQDALFLELIMEFQDGVLREMRLHDSLDQHSRLRFRDIELNETIDDSVFELDIPDGVDVIRNPEHG